MFGAEIYSDLISPADWISDQGLLVVPRSRLKTKRDGALEVKADVVLKI